MAVCLLTTVTPVLAGAALPPWPTDAKDESGVRVVAYYQTRCNQRAGDLDGGDGDQTLQPCEERMRHVHPVGLEADDE